MKTKCKNIEPIFTIGFVVIMHNPLNYDIDISMKEEEKQRYKDVEKYKYTFKDTSCTETQGTVYRCRLKDVHQKPTHLQKMNNRYSPLDKLYYRIFDNKINQLLFWETE